MAADGALERDMQQTDEIDDAVSSITQNAADHLVNARALQELIDMAAVDSGLLIKLVLLAEQPESRAILDALSQANMAEIGTVSTKVCALLDGIKVNITDTWTIVD